MVQATQSPSRRTQEDQNSGALPGFDLVNQATENLKSVINNGERAITAKKACAYLGYRLFSYSFIPALANLISVVVSGILCLATLPLRCCSKSINQYFFKCCMGSLGYLSVNILMDLTCDFRQLGRLCSCTSPTFYEI
ncbi:MAG: hypothetical protein JJU12_03275 [Chlamydiales bacterium]|nr:hypothetical protein [Chlamydiales bacterium]